MNSRRILVCCAVKHDGASIDWNLIAREAQRHDGVERFREGEITERSPQASEAHHLLSRVTRDDWSAAVDKVDAEMEAAEKAGARLVTVVDDDYPSNLRLIFNLPPFLFMRGEVRRSDARSMAVVGTRSASEKGRRQAVYMARRLAETDVTVVSGLAAGIDTVAHQSAIVNGGRTIAVIGTGIAAKCYPPENADLAEEIVEHGAVVSQFWPTSGPARWTFPRRNVVTSGISQGTVVIEASSTSGAKMQARLALEHGKQVFVIRQLVTDQKWARDYVAKRGAIEIGEPDDVLRWIASPEAVRDTATRSQQLVLEL